MATLADVQALISSWISAAVSWIEGLASGWAGTFNAAEQKKIAIQGLNQTGTKENLQRVWDSIPASLQADPDVLAAYNQGLASDIPSKIDLKTQIEDLTKGLDSGLLDLYTSITPISVAAAPKAALDLIAADTLANIGVGVGAAIIESGSLGLVHDAGEFQKFLRARTGYGGPMTMLMKAPVEMALMRPLSYWLHTTFRNEMPEGKELVYAYWKGLLDDPGTLASFNGDPVMAGYNVSNGRELVDRVLSFQGLPSWWTDIHIEGMYRAMNPRQLGDVLQDSTVDDAWLAKHIRAYGIDPADVPIFQEAIKGRFFMGFMKAVAAKLGKEYADGYIDLTTYNTEMTVLGFPPAVIDLERQVAKMEFDIELNKDLKAEWIAQYLHDVISEDELRLNLSDIIVSPRMVDAIVGLAKARHKIPKAPGAAGLKQGVRISSKPSWIPVWVDGLDVQRLTRATIGLLPGPHTVELRSPDYYPTSHSLNVLAGEYIDIHDVLKALPTLYSIQLTPGSANVTTGGTVRFSASGTDQYGDPYPLSSAISWSTISPTIASVDSSGNVTGAAPGTTYVQARSGFAFGQAAVTVT